MDIRESDHAQAVQVLDADSSEALSTEGLPERRSQRRLPIELPIEILAVDGTEAGWIGTTWNIGLSGGIRFECPHHLRVGQHVQYIVTLSQGHVPIRISCFGFVVRCNPVREPSSGFDTALTMARFHFVRASELSA